MCFSLTEGGPGADMSGHGVVISVGWFGNISDFPGTPE